MAHYRGRITFAIVLVVLRLANTRCATLTQIVMTSLPATGGSCAYSGTLAQFGQMGDVVGIFSCSNGSAGSLHIFEFQVTEYSVIGRFTASATVPAGCQATGWFGALHVTTF